MSARGVHCKKDMLARGSTSQGGHCVRNWEYIMHYVCETNNEKLQRWQQYS